MPWGSPARVRPGRGDARVAPPCPTTLCVWRKIYLTLPYFTLFVQADKHVLIESRHGAITAGDYILGRIRSNFDKKG